MENDFYSIHNIAEKLQVAYLTVYRWIRVGKLKAYKVGRQYRVKESDFNEFLEKHKHK